MAVDRILRDEVANALGAYLRQETSITEYVDRVIAIRESMDREDCADEFLLDLVDSTEHLQPAMSERYWNRLCRDFAFLKSDLENRNFEIHTCSEPASAEEIRRARLHLVGLIFATLSAGVIAAQGHWMIAFWITVLSLVLSMTIYRITINDKIRVNTQREKEELSRLMAHMPFNSDEEWLAYEPIVRAAGIPGYELNRKVTPALRTRLLNAVVIALLIMIIVPLLVLVTVFGFALSIIIWPFEVFAVAKGRSGLPAFINLRIGLLRSSRQPAKPFDLGPTNRF